MKRRFVMRAIGMVSLLCVTYALGYTQQARQDEYWIRQNGMLYASPRRVQIDNLIAAEFFVARAASNIYRMDLSAAAKETVLQFLHHEVDAIRRERDDLEAGGEQPVTTNCVREGG